MAKAIMFTDDELRTIIFAIQNQHAKSTIAAIGRHENPSENEIVKRLSSISKKAYEELTSRH